MNLHFSSLSHGIRVVRNFQLVCGRGRRAKLSVAATVCVPAVGVTSISETLKGSSLILRLGPARKLACCKVCALSQRTIGAQGTSSADGDSEFLAAKFRPPPQS